MTGQQKIRFYGLRDIETMPELQALSKEDRFDMQVVAHVLPFRSNNYVVENLIDWDRVPTDPMFQLTFPQRTMLSSAQFDRMASAIVDEKSKAELDSIANSIRLELEPHPAGQLTANVPKLDGIPVPGIQHKYRETALVFPSNGQTCHAYCSFCFRWPQFIGVQSLKFATDESRRFATYIQQHREITDVLFTGGDPMIMGVRALRNYVEPLLEPEFDHIQTIRIGTKSLSYWPHRYVTDKDADEVLELFEKVVQSGKQLAFMAHINHWVELSTPSVRHAIRRIRETGAQIRAQAPLVRHVNDDPNVWTRLWEEEVELGIAPYYMFVERNTGARSHFGIPLARALKIYRAAIQRVSGLARTVRGPVMSALPGKICIDGVAEIKGERVFVLRFLQGRNPDWAHRPFFARYDASAEWLHELRPAFSEDRFFYEDEFERLLGRTPRRPGVSRASLGLLN